MNSYPLHRKHWALVWALASGHALLAPSQAHAAPTDIASTPLVSGQNVVKPNIMFILDASGSMDQEYMPDNAGVVQSGPGYKSAQCNGLAYNPKTLYVPPKTPDGRDYPNMDLASVWDNGYTPTLNNPTTSSTALALPGGNPTLATPLSLTVASMANLAVNNTVAIVSTADPSRWILGTVKSLGGGALVVVPSFASSSGSTIFNSWSVGRIATSSLDGSVYDTYTGAEKPLNWTYNSDGTAIVTPFYTECNSTSSSQFNAVTVTVNSAEAINYANWYAYYRKRIMTMKAAASRAFSTLDNYRRVGFTTIHDSTIVPSTTFLDTSDFDLNQKVSFFSDLFQATPMASTPLRGALSKAGHYFAHFDPASSKLITDSKIYDPIQYACQRNYAVMSTDGYWNDGNETPTYGPYKLDGKNVGQQDGPPEVLPMQDGVRQQVTATTTTTQNYPKEQVVSTSQTTTTFTRHVYTVVKPNTCTNGALAYSDQKQQGSRTTTTTTTTVYNRTQTKVDTAVTVNNIQTSSQNGTFALTSSTVVSSNSTSSTTPSTVTYSNAGAPTTKCYGSPPSSPSTATSSSSTSSPSPDVTTELGTLPAPQVSTTSSSATVGASTDSLADVAEYYYATSLRTTALGNCTGAAGANVCNADPNLRQRLNTFTIGLGVKGTLDFDPNYLQQTSGTYVDITNGKAFWPVPYADQATAVDDLWHAAVDGRGQYFAASDPSSLVDSLTGVFRKIDELNSAGTAAATSSLQPTAGTDQIYVATYTTKSWSGEIQATGFKIDATGLLTFITDGAWTAPAGLDGMSAQQVAARKIFYMSKAADGSFSQKDFTYTNLSADGYGGYLSGFCSQAMQPAQCSGLSTVAPPNQTDVPATIVNLGANLVNYLRGDSTYETSNTNYPLYRARPHKLGDIVNGSPVFVGAPVFSYGDIGYSDFKNSNLKRKPMLYVPANDGMLHAFSADTSTGGDKGTELWAFVPSMVMPNLYRLADTGYANNHRYFVDATPIVADVQMTINNAKVWRTILVGGLGAGGRGYYALDITDAGKPPTPLWEFTDTNLGLTFGPPIVTKRANGKWVVAVSSGLNNTSNGDGNGHFYMLDAATGKPLLDIPTYTGTKTAAGSADTPSGLMKLNAWINNTADNTALRFYGADMLGNVWRFNTENIDTTQPMSSNGVLLAQLQTNASTPTPQPVTARVELAELHVNGTAYPLVVVGTGRYMGFSDITDSTLQSLYVFKDPLTSTGWGVLRKNSGMVNQSFTQSGDKALITQTAADNKIPVDWSTQTGWYIDFTLNERVAIDMALQYSAIALVTAIPSAEVCSTAGSSWLYYFDLAKGTSALGVGSTDVGQRLGDVLGMGLTWLELPDGSTQLLIPTSDAKTQIKNPKIDHGSGGKPATRTSWRELTN